MPDDAGKWTYRASFRTGGGIAVSAESKAGAPTAFDGQSGSFVIAPVEKSAPGFYAKGQLEYVGDRYLAIRCVQVPQEQGIVEVRVAAEVRIVRRGDDARRAPAHQLITE